MVDWRVSLEVARLVGKKGSTKGIKSVGQKGKKKVDMWENGTVVSRENMMVDLKV
eukprot:CAMPEP_0170100738 /NCGR_PEP_ID=MMETSP0020_2-20130122/1833_1 /TAXON_ID=98059 /ORGANISM="Dinobryon sp., Strain UTEXLB2267" /LENGTH=54 /DNA_ID=CAMNT_0010323683 /DNA_START=524 /DNA_END=688 /DNA_ORIENTATION=+